MPLIGAVADDLTGRQRQVCYWQDRKQEQRCFLMKQQRKIQKMQKR